MINIVINIYTSGAAAAAKEKEIKNLRKSFHVNSSHLIMHGSNTELIIIESA